MMKRLRERWSCECVCACVSHKECVWVKEEHEERLNDPPERSYCPCTNTLNPSFLPPISYILPGVNLRSNGIQLPHLAALAITQTPTHKALTVQTHIHL